MEKENLKFRDSNIFEGMTSLSALLNSTCGNDRRIKEVWIDEQKRRAKAKEIGFLTAKSKERGFAISFVPTEKIDQIATGSSHGGILAFCTDRTLPILTSLQIEENGFYVFLEGIEDPFNFGYTLRSLYAAGVSGVVLSPRNWMNAAGVVARASAGASELLPMYVSSAENVIPIFRERGYLTLCAGIRDSVSVFEEQFPLPLLLVIGGEKRGISRTVLDQADRIVRIDYGREFRGSLSAASAATVLAFEILRQNRKK